MKTWAVGAFFIFLLSSFALHAELPGSCLDLLAAPETDYSKLEIENFKIYKSPKEGSGYYLMRRLGRPMPPQEGKIETLLQRFKRYYNNLGLRFIADAWIEYPSVEKLNERIAELRPDAIYADIPWRFVALNIPNRDLDRLSFARFIADGKVPVLIEGNLTTSQPAHPHDIRVHMPHFLIMHPLIAQKTMGRLRFLLELYDSPLIEKYPKFKDEISEFIHFEVSALDRFTALLYYFFLPEYQAQAPSIQHLLHYLTRGSQDIAQFLTAEGPQKPIIPNDINGDPLFDENLRRLKPLDFDKVSFQDLPEFRALFNRAREAGLPIYQADQLPELMLKRLVMVPPHGFFRK